MKGLFASDQFCVVFRVLFIEEMARKQIEFSSYMIPSPKVYRILVSYIGVVLLFSQDYTWPPIAKTTLAIEKGSCI